MVRRIIQIGLIAMVGLLVVATPVYAIINAAFVADLVTINAGTATTNVAAVCDINTQALIDGKYVTADLKNTAVQGPGDIDVPYMPGVGTNPWVYFVSDIGASEQKCYSFYAGGTVTQNTFAYFPASGGMTVADDDSIELGNNFEVEFQGFVDTSAGTNKDLVFKDLAFRVWVNGEGEISASIYKDGGWTACVVTATNILSNVHFIEVTADVQDLKLYINGNLKDTEVLGGTISVPDNTNGWSFATNGSMLYLEFLKIWVG